MTKLYKLSEEQVQNVERALGRLDEVVAEVETLKNAAISDDDMKTIADTVTRQMRAAKATGDGKRRTFNAGEGDATIDPGLGEVNPREATRIWMGNKIKKSVAAQLRAKGNESGRLLEPDEDLEVAASTLDRRAAEMRQDRLYSPGATRSNEGDPAFTECGLDFAWEVIAGGTPLVELIPSRPTRNGKLKWRVYGNIIESYGMEPTQDCSAVKCTPTSNAVINTDEIAAKLFKSAGCVSRTDLEDAFWDVIGELSDKLLEDAQRTREYAFQRGDLTLGGSADENFNHFGQTIAVPSASVVPAYAHFDGLQHAWLIDNPANNGSANYWDEGAGPAAPAATPEGWFAAGSVLTFADIQKLRNLMHDAATNRHLGYGANLIATMTPGLYGMLVTLDELIGQCCGNGPAVSGVLPNVGGIPHFWSEHMPMTDEYGRVQMSAPGVPDVAANIYHSYQLLNLDSFIRGEAAGLELIVEMDNDCEKIKPILRWREVLGRRSTSGAAGGIEGIAGITGISLS